jgi:hypothetical protein
MANHRVMLYLYTVLCPGPLDRVAGLITITLRLRENLKLIPTGHENMKRPIACKVAQSHLARQGRE